MQSNVIDAVRVFERDEVQLFVAAGSVTVGLVAIGFSLVRRRFDRLLSFFAWFAVLYGIRLWFQSNIHSLIAAPSLAMTKTQLALNFLVEIPAFLFFDASGLIGRAGRYVVHVVCLAVMCLILGVFLGWPLAMLDRLNSILVISGSVSAVALSFRQPINERHGQIFRLGLLIFVGFVLWTNVADLFGYRTKVELYGFAAFLCCLGYITAEKALDREEQLSAVKQELDIAHRIQLTILPKEPPRVGSVAIAARYLPMTSVAGDFYEYLHTEQSGLGLLIADASGHGIPAALIASMMKVAVKSQRHFANQPERLLGGVNEALCGMTQNQFVTAAYLHLDTTGDKFSYAAAGHPPMLLLRSGQVSEISENGLVLALMPSAAYASITQPLLANDRFLLYTDGLIEATNAYGEEFGHQRLCDLLGTTGSWNIEETADSILRALAKWSPTQNDDLTVIVCDYRRDSCPSR